MKSFSLKPAGTGSTSKSHKSHKSHKSQSLSISSSTSTSASTSSSNAASVVSSSLAHAKLATSAAWSACKNSTKSTLKKGSSAFKTTSSDRKSRALSASPASASLDWNQGQPRTYSPPRRVRRLFGFGSGNTPLSARMSMARYRSLGGEFDSDDDRDIFSGRPFSERVDVHPKDFDFWQDGNTRGNSRGREIEREIIPVPYTYKYTPQHAASSYLATSTAKHMQFSADNGEGDDDEWWRD